MPFSEIFGVDYGKNWRKIPHSQNMICIYRIQCLIAIEPIYVAELTLRKVYLKVNKSKLGDYELYYHADDREDRYFILIDELDNDYLIRSKAVDFDVPLITNLQLAKRFAETLHRTPIEDLKSKSWDEYNQLPVISIE